MHLRRLGTLLGLTLASANVLAAPVYADHPPAWECAPLVLTGVRVPTLPGEVQSVEAVVQCRLSSVLGYSYAEATALYKGVLALGAIRSDGVGQTCIGGSVIEVPAAGTMILTGTGVCVWDAAPPGTTYRPIAYWSTANLDGTGGSLASNENMGTDSYRASFANNL